MHKVAPEPLVCGRQKFVRMGRTQKLARCCAQPALVSCKPEQEEPHWSHWQGSSGQEANHYYASLGLTHFRGAIKGALLHKSHPRRASAPLVWAWLARAAARSACSLQPAVCSVQCAGHTPTQSSGSGPVFSVHTVHCERAAQRARLLSTAPPMGAHWHPLAKTAAEWPPLAALSAPPPRRPNVKFMTLFISCQPTRPQLCPRTARQQT